MFHPGNKIMPNWAATLIRNESIPLCLLKQQNTHRTDYFFWCGWNTSAVVGESVFIIMGPRIIIEHKSSNYNENTRKYRRRKIKSNQNVIVNYL